MTIEAFNAINTIRARAAVAAVGITTWIPVAHEQVMAVTNVERHAMASFEDYSINWTDYSFEYLAED